MGDFITGRLDEQGRYRYPHPTKPDVWVSRQRLYQIRKTAAGLCRQCGQRKVFRWERCRACYHRHGGPQP